LADKHHIYFEIAKRTFAIESHSVSATISELDEKEFVRACEIILSRKGRVVVSGIGKSGHIGRKIASTLSSTGTPALFLHPSEAAHGDLGFLGDGDTVIMLSKSGESEELAAILPAITGKKVPIIAITASKSSRLAKAALQSGGALLAITIAEEACPHDLAPTSSTTAQLVLGDALAMALLEARNFSSEDFAKLHPAGALGRRLTYSVRDLMYSGNDIPRIKPSDTLLQAMHVISDKRIGAACVMNGNKLLGIITDGDLRRFFESRRSVDLSAIKAEELMSKKPKTIREDALAIEALRFMQDEPPKVMHLPVLDGSDDLVGVIHIHDIVKAGISEPT
jgi:arabinose-5-phosphate isomerase